jgi:hypothetical protein
MLWHYNKEQDEFQSGFIISVDASTYIAADHD